MGGLRGGAGNVGGGAEEGVGEREGDEGADGQDEEGEELRIGIIVVFGRHGGGLVASAGGVLSGGPSSAMVPGPVFLSLRDAWERYDSRLSGSGIRSCISTRSWCALAQFPLNRPSDSTWLPLPS